MLFNSATSHRIRQGEISVSLRKWRRAQARVGGVYYLRPKGAVEVTSLEEYVLGEVSSTDLGNAGFPDLAAAASVLSATEDDVIWVVRFDFRPDATRPAPDRESASEDELVVLAGKLAKKDKTSAEGPWTHATLALIGRQPGTVSTELAAQLGRDRQDFKRDVRKLKALGLTISLEVGYQLSDKGLSLLAWLDRQ